MSDEIEVGSVLAGQAERIPAHPDDEIGLVGTLLVEAVQARGTGKVTVADAYLAPDGCAALDGLGTVLVGQLEMREAATLNSRKVISQLTTAKPMSPSVSGRVMSERALMAMVVPFRIGGG